MSVALEHAPEIPGLSLTKESKYPTIYRLGGWAAALAAVATPLSVGIFAMSPPPGYDEGAAVWFRHLQDNAFLGLMNLDFPFLVVSALMIPVMIALYVALRDTRPEPVAVAAIIYLIAVATYFGTNTSIEMLALSERYADATSEIQRISLLGAGEALLAAYNSTAFHINYILGQVAGIILGVVMLNSHLFSRKIASLMIVGNALGFLLYTPVIGIALSAFAGVILWVWMILVARRLFQLAHVAGRSL